MRFSNWPAWLQVWSAVFLIGFFPVVTTELAGHGLERVITWADRWQTLITGVLAITAARMTINEMRRHRQLLETQDEKGRRERVERDREADRIMWEEAKAGFIKSLSRASAKLHDMVPNPILYTFPDNGSDGLREAITDIWDYCAVPINKARAVSFGIEWSAIDFIVLMTHNKLNELSERFREGQEADGALIDPHEDTFGALNDFPIRDPDGNHWHAFRSGVHDAAILADQLQTYLQTAGSKAETKG